jgi:hypothetical protein
MAEYYEKSAPGQNQGQSLQVEIANAVGHDRGYEPYLDVAAEYGLEDEMDIGNLGGDVQTVDQEYQAYVMGTPSSKAVDILKFWEAGVYNDFLFILTERYRLIVLPFPPFSPLQWTTFRFKRPLSLAKEFFPQALKRIQNGGIASPPS